MTEDILISGQQGRRYKIISATPIDHGSTSQLFLGEQIAPQDEAGRKAVVKVALSADQKPFFEKEVEVLSLLWDIVPGTVPELYDSNLEAKRPYLIMEYLASARSLSELAQESPEGCLSEKEAVYWASRYGEILGALHDVDFAAPDRKLGDLLLVQKGRPVGDDSDSYGFLRPAGSVVLRPSESEDGLKHPLGNWRLVVVDWGGVTSLTPSLAQFDLLLFTQFWYTLMLGGRSLPDISLGTRRLDHHRRWGELSYGVQQILSRGLSRVTHRRYREIGELLSDWRELEIFWSKSPEDLERAFQQSRQTRAYEKALRCLDVIRLVDRPRWQRYQAEIDPLRNEIDIADVLVRQIKEAIRRGESLADSNVKGPLKRGSEQYGDDPEWELRAHRWMILAEFSGSLSAEAHKVFREDVVGHWIEAIEAVEEDNWQKARDLFWQPLGRLVSPGHAHPQIEAKIASARELLHAGKRIEAQECINAAVEELTLLGASSFPQRGGTPKAAIDLLRNVFFPAYPQRGGTPSHSGSILSLLIEIEVRHHMVDLVANLSSGRATGLRSSSSALSLLREQLSYIPLLENAGTIWPSRWHNSLDEQLDLCERVDQVLAEVAVLCDKGDFRGAQWALETVDREFDFSGRKPIEPESPQILVSEVNAILHNKRYQVRTELKKVADLIRTEQLLERTLAQSGDFYQVLATLETLKEVADNAYFRWRAAGMIEQVRSVLRRGPALTGFETVWEGNGPDPRHGAGRSAMRGEVA